MRGRNGSRRPPVEQEPRVKVRREPDLASRLFWVRLGFLMAFALVAVHLFWLQVDPDMQISDVAPSEVDEDDPNLTNLTRENLKHIGTLSIPIPRGDIVDRGGSLLATDRFVDSLWADPGKIGDPYTASLILSSVLGMDEDTLADRLAKRDAEGNSKRFVWIKRRLSDVESKAVREAEKRLGPGFALKSEPVRFYPEGQLASFVLGFANREGLGCEGVERSSDEYLRSVPGQQLTRVDARRNVLDSLTLEYVEPQGGHTVELTIDKAIQFSLEKELDAAMERTKAPGAMGLLMDPFTGAIYALSCRPAFDPNNYSDFPAEQMKNRALVDVFEPGSAFKIVTFSAALERGLITPEMMIDCMNGRFNPYGKSISDVHRLGVVPISHAFAESSNIATIKIAAMLTSENLAEWIKRYGFGQKTCDDFPAESRGIVWPLSKWTKRSMGAVPIGQEISVTIMQLARAYCVIANGGQMVNPYLVQRVVNREGAVVFEHANAPGERVISEATASTMRELMHLVVKEGTGMPAIIPEYRVAGKTGTAQVAKEDGRGYYADKYTAIFAGFAPVSHPRICGVIVIQKPGIREHWGGYCSGPVFKTVVRDALIRLGCPEEPMTSPIPTGPPIPEETPLQVAQAGDDDVILASDAPLDGLSLLQTHRAINGEPVLPSFINLTMSQAKTRLMQLGIPWDFQGAGRVVTQEPPADTPLRDVTMCRLVFANKPVEPAANDAAPTRPTTRM